MNNIEFLFVRGARNHDNFTSIESAEAYIAKHGHGGPSLYLRGRRQDGARTAASIGIGQVRTVKAFRELLAQPSTQGWMTWLKEYPCDHSNARFDRLRDQEAKKRHQKPNCLLAECAIST